jgi:hypothetical protein
VQGAHGEKPKRTLAAGSVIRQRDLGGLLGQQRSSLSAEEKTVGLKGDGGREPGTGGN